MNLEGQNIEYKRIWKDEYLKWVSGFAQIFYRAGFIEAWGRGYEKINKAFDEANLKRPTFISEQGGISAIIPREVFMSVRDGGVIKQDSHDNIGDGTVQELSNNRLSPEQKPNRNRTETEQKPNRREEKEKIAELMKANSKITRGALSEILNLHESSVQRRIDALVKEGRIKRIGSDSNGIWEVLKD